MRASTAGPQRLRDSPYPTEDHPHTTRPGTKHWGRTRVTGGSMGNQRTSQHWPHAVPTTVDQLQYLLPHVQFSHRELWIIDPSHS